MTRLEKLVDRMETLDPNDQTRALRDEVIGMGCEYGEPAQDAAFTIGLHGVTALGYSEADAARIWVMNARSAIGGFPLPDRAKQAAQIRWATHVLANPRSHSRPMVDQSCTIILTLSANRTLRDRARAVMPATVL